MIILSLAILVPNLDNVIRGRAEEDARLEGVPLQAVHWAVVRLYLYFWLSLYLYLAGAYFNADNTLGI